MSEQPVIVTTRTSSGVKLNDVYLDGLRIGRFRRYEFGTGYKVIPAFFCGGVDRAVAKGGALTRTKQQAIDRLVLLYREAVPYAATHQLEIVAGEDGSVVLLRNGARFEMSHHDYCHLMNTILQIREHPIGTDR